jgi:hypothetical protein
VATREDVRKLCLALPGTTQHPRDFRFDVDGKGFAWAWKERLNPKRARVPNPGKLLTDAWRLRGGLATTASQKLDPSRSSRLVLEEDQIGS